MCRGCVIRIASLILIHIHNIRFYGEYGKLPFFFHFDTNPRFPPFLLYVRLKLWGIYVPVMSIRRYLPPTISMSIKCQRVIFLTSFYTEKTNKKQNKKKQKNKKQKKTTTKKQTEKKNTHKNNNNNNNSK